MDLPDALDARTGIVSVVGAGGKKTTLYALAARVDRAVVTATVRIPPFEDAVASLEVTDDPVSVVEATDDRPVGVVAARERSDRYRGFDTDQIGAIADAAEGPVLVKADGARMRELKAPGSHEPQIPSETDTVVPVVSAHAVGEPLDADTVHRPERVAAATDLSVGDEITAEAVGRLLGDSAGGWKNVPEGASVVPLVNKVDDEEDRAVAERIADQIPDHADCSRVVLARMKTPEVVDIV
ncbi:MAG: selenium cofactor biosynthesis protein YqeC [Halobaculum sp.]